jgi:flagellar motor switch protein FliM
MTAPNPENDISQCVIEFDFRKRDDLPPADIQDFRAVQEAFARELGDALSRYFRKEFSISLAAIQQLTWARYSERFTEPACLMLLRSQVLPGFGAIEVGQTFVFSVLETLLGGTSERGSGPSRELTSIEKKLLARFFQSIQRQLQHVWDAGGPEFVLEAVIGSPGEAIGRILAEEPLVVAEFVVKADGTEGHMCLAVPKTFVRQHRQNPDTVAASTNTRPPWGAGPILKQLRKGTVRAETVLTKATIRMGDLRALAPGDVINLDYPISSPLAICINGAEIFSGFIVPAGGKRAFAIQSEPQRGARLAL